MFSTYPFKITKGGIYLNLLITHNKSNFDVFTSFHLESGINIRYREKDHQCSPNSRSSSSGLGAEQKYGSCWVPESLLGDKPRSTWTALDSDVNEKSTFPVAGPGDWGHLRLWFPVALTSGLSDTEVPLHPYREVGPEGLALPVHLWEMHGLSDLKTLSLENACDWGSLSLSWLFCPTQSWVQLMVIEHIFNNKSTLFVNQLYAKTK